MIFMSLTIVNTLLCVLCCSQFCLDAFPHGATHCFFSLNSLLSLTKDLNVCGEKSQ